MRERFYLEWRRAHWYIIGDMVSSTINLLTNFSKYFHLAAPVVSYLVITLLAFTFLKLIYFYTIEKHKYDEHEQYLLELNNTVSEEYRLTATVLLKQLNHQRTVMQWRLLLSVIASLFLLTAFVISITCAPQVTLPLFLYMSVIGGVMYLSADSFGQFMCARKEYQCDNHNATKRSMMIEKRKLFTSTMIKDLVVPIVLVGLFAINWPAALTLSLLYIALMYYFTKKHRSKMPLDGIPSVIQLERSPKHTYASFFTYEQQDKETYTYDTTHDPNDFTCSQSSQG